MRRASRQPSSMREHTHARTACNEKREIIPHAACGPFVVRPYCRGGTDRRGQMGRGGGGERHDRGVRSPRVRSFSLSHGTPRKPPQEDCHLLICRRASSRRRVCVRDDAPSDGLQNNVHLSIDAALRACCLTDARARVSSGRLNACAGEAAIISRI